MASTNLPPGGSPSPNNGAGMITVVHGWRSLRLSFPIRKSEWVCAGVLFGLAVILRLNDNLFTESRGYDAMARFAPQWAWQWALFLVSVARLAVLGINGAYWRTPHFRAAAAFLSCFAWWQLAAGLAPNAGIGIVFVAGFFVLDTFNFKQALTEAGVSGGLRHVERRNVGADT